MKTAKEKAAKVVDRFVSELGIDVSVMVHRDMESIIAFALKEQDRDTRHACAEAVVDCYSAEEAHDNCMNVQAV